MTITQQTNAGATVKATVLPNGPVTEMRWYRTPTTAGLLVTFRRTRNGAVESMTFTTQVAGKLRRLRVLPPPCA